MKLHQSSATNRLAKQLAPMLSNLILGERRLDLMRKMIAYGNYLMGKGAGTGWDLETEVKSAAACIARSEAVVFDVGANVGHWSLLLRKYVPDAKIYLFEPQPTCREEIEKLHIGKSEIIPFAVSDQPGRLELYTSSETDGSASLFAREDSFFSESTYQSFPVDVIVLDEFIEQRGIDYVDFMKFDIEGNELAALRGLQKLISSNKLGAFSIEFGSGNLNSRTCFRDFWKLLSPTFEIYRITPGSALIQVNSYYEDIEFYRGASNYLAVAKINQARQHGLLSTAIGEG